MVCVLLLVSISFAFVYGRKVRDPRFHAAGKILSFPLHPFLETVPHSSNIKTVIARSFDGVHFRLFLTFFLGICGQQSPLLFF